MAMRPAAGCPGIDWPTSTSRPSRLASFSVRPAQAISGSVKTTAGNRLRLERGRLAGEDLDGHLAFVGRLVGEHRFAGHVADGQDVRIGRPLLLVDDDEALVVDLDLRVFQADAAACWAGGRPRPARGRTRWTLSTLGAFECRLRSCRRRLSASTTLVFRWIAGEVLREAACAAA